MTTTTGVSGGFLSNLSDEQKIKNARQELLNIIQSDRCVGDLIRMDYNTAEVLIHDRLRADVNGVPHGCLLIATRINPEKADHDLDDHQTSFLLLRAIKSSALPNDLETQRSRLDAGLRASQTSQNWDQDGKTDQFTLDQMRFAGLHCNILGTFRMHLDPDNREWSLAHGEDIDNFYAGQGMKIYKPAGGPLEQIINYIKAEHRNSATKPVRIGQLRYAATIHKTDTPESVPVYIRPEDMIAQRTALFGMTRTGKSNTTKTIASAVFTLRLEQEGQRVGQLIFDPNGEYANENPQDQGCIRNLANLQGISPGDVITYGLYPHPNDPDRNITRFNFYGTGFPSGASTSKTQMDQDLQTLYEGKEIINEALSAETTAAYVKDFMSADVTAPDDVNQTGPYTRYRRALLVYMAALQWAGFIPPSNSVRTKGLFNKDIINLMKDSPDMAQYGIQLENNESQSWDIMRNFCEALSEWVKTKKFKDYDRDYAQKRGYNWSDTRLLNMLRIFENPAGRAVMQRTNQWHSTESSTDYAQDIVKHIREGKLVIIDQALGTPEMNQQAAARIMRGILSAQQQDFTNPPQDEITGEFKKPPPVIIYVEEAHNLLPKDSEKDTTNIWARTAKEGAKFNIGLAYSTQEPTSIMPNILTNTENWFIAHLNNTDETRQLAKYNDFADFTDSILKVKQIGYLKVRTQSSIFTLPVQIDKFAAPPPTPDGRTTPSSNGINPQHVLPMGDQ